MEKKRILEWVAISFSNACMHAKSLLLCGPYGQQPTRLLCLWDSPGRNTGVGCHFLLHSNGGGCIKLYAAVCPRKTAGG